MDRKHFIRLSAIGSSILTTQLAIAGNILKKLRDKSGFMVSNGKDRNEKPINLLEGDTFYTKVSSLDTDGDMYVFESTRINEGGPSLHYHYSQDEWWYILEGEFIIKVGNELYNAKAGDSVFGPRGIPHTFSKTGNAIGRMLITFQPAGKMEAFFQAVSEGKLKGKSEAEQNAARKLHGFEKVGPAISHFKGF